MKQRKSIKIGLLKGVILCARYQKMPLAQQKLVQQQRLRDIIAYARESSPYYHVLYRDIPENFALSDLPPVDKRTLMAHFDEWVTDRNVKFENVEAFMQNLDNVG